MLELPITKRATGNQVTKQRKTNAERQADHRAKMAASGFSRLQLYVHRLDRDAVKRYVAEKAKKRGQ